MTVIELGATYHDRVTGFTGVCTGLIEYISGCKQACLTPEAKDNKFEDGQWLDVQRLRRESKPVVKLDNSKTPGFGPRPPRRA